MTKNYFEVIRPGINTTFQDLGRKNLENIKSFGVDVVEFAPNKKVRKIIAMFSNIVLIITSYLL